MKKELRGGYTTGACAAAGVKAALIFFASGGRDVRREVTITALDGTKLVIPVKNVEQTEDGASAETVKFSGDDPDITNGVSVFSSVRLLEGETGIVFRAGQGVGRVTRAGLSVPVGEPAINTGPRKLIGNVAREILGEGVGLEVTISIPAGKELAKKTLNGILGIEGGISVLGTTGVLRPMSEEAFKNSLAVQIDVAKAAELFAVVLVPGKIGENIAEKYGVNKKFIVQTSNFIGFMLEKAVEADMKKILLLGHLGKLAKVAAGSFYTHNRASDGRMEAIAAYAAEAGADVFAVRKILAAATTEEALAVLRENGLAETVCARLAERAALRAERYIFRRAEVGAVLVTLKGEILGMDDKAKAIGRELQWTLADTK